MVAPLDSSMQTAEDQEIQSSGLKHRLLFEKWEKDRLQAFTTLKQDKFGRT